MAERGLALEPQAVAGHLTLARVLVEEGPAGRDRAAELLARAEALARDAAAAGVDSGYARELSALDADKVAALRERVMVAGGPE